MGGAASAELPARLDRSLAQRVAGARWDAAQFERLATDGTITREQFISANSADVDSDDSDSDEMGQEHSRRVGSLSLRGGSRRVVDGEPTRTLTLTYGNASVSLTAGLASTRLGGGTTGFDITEAAGPTAEIQGQGQGQGNGGIGLSGPRPDIVGGERGGGGRGGETVDARDLYRPGHAIELNGDVLYVVDRLLGAGAFGEVYLVHRPWEVHRFRAMKVRLVAIAVLLSARLSLLPSHPSPSACGSTASPPASGTRPSSVCVARRA